MARMSNSEKMRKVGQRALERFDKVISVAQPERMQCLKDRRFCDIPGAQWEGALSAQYENKPQFEFNEVHNACIRIENEYRNNRVTADFVPKDGAKNEKLADTCDGLFRADESDSNANEAYDNAFSEGIRGGFGAWRLRAEYEDMEDEESTRQRIRIEPIYEADSCVFFDLDARRQDKRDAKYCFVLNPMTFDDYRERYNDDPSTWDRTVTASEFDWATPDIVYVAEYYEVEDAGKTILYFQGLTGDTKRYSQDEYDESQELQQELQATGYSYTQKKTIPVKKIHKYIVSGGGNVLEDIGYIAGNRIPIVPYFGKRFFIDGVERCMGHVRLAKDAQRLKNMQISKLAEIASFSAREKPILTPEQIAGYEYYWDSDHIKDYSHLLLNPITDTEGNTVIGPLAYTHPPQIPQALAALIQTTAQDLASILGNQQNADKLVSNISGKAVEMIQTRLDLQAFIYISNFAKAKQATGEIWLGMAKEIYVEDGRKMKTVGVNNESGTVELNRPILDENNAVVYENDLSAARLDVQVEVGPSFTTQRESMNRNITNMIGLIDEPETKSILQSMLIMNLDGEGLSDIREYFRKRLVDMGVYTPTEEDMQRMQQQAQSQQEDPNSILAKAMAVESQAKAAKYVADTSKVESEVKLNDAKTLETLAGIDAQERANLANTEQMTDYEGMQETGYRPPMSGEMEE